MPPKVKVLTISLACLTDSGEVLVAAALEGSLSVVTDVGARTKLLTLILICVSVQTLNTG